MMLLIRWIIMFGLIAAIAAGGLWVMDHPGTIQLDWLGYRINTPFWVMGLAVIATIFIGFFLIWIWLKLVYNISLLGSKRGAKHQQQGMDALTETVVALSIRDYSGAKGHLAKSQKLLGNTPLNSLLSAHIASKSGDKATALTALKDMQEHPATQFLAISSLGNVASQDGDIEEALNYAKEAYALRPDVQSAALAYLGLLVKTEHYSEAAQLLTKAARQKCFSKDERQHLKALLHYAHYSAAETHEPAILKAAFVASPEFAPAYQHIAELHEQGKDRAALAALYKAWKANPHPELVDMLLHYFDDEQPHKMLKRGQVLLKHQPDHLESHIAMARLALGAKQWDMARNHLKAALSLSSQMRVFQLLARLEEEELHDESAASAWLKRMQYAAPDPAWHCKNCGHHADHWATHCEACNSFDGYAWGNPFHTDTAQTDALLLDTPKLLSE